MRTSGGEIRFSKTAARVLLRSNKRNLIQAKIDELACDRAALDANVIRLQGRPEYRLRVQDWRIIVRIEASILWIDVLRPVDQSMR